MKDATNDVLKEIEQRSSAKKWALSCKELDKKFISYQLAQSELDDEIIVDLFISSNDIDPNEDFSCEKYLEANPDVVGSDYHPFEHYVLFGRKEGRAVQGSEKFELFRRSKEYVLDDSMQFASKANAGVFFDEAYYNDKWQGSWGWKHYLEYGYKEYKDTARGVIPEALDNFFSVKGRNNLPLLTMVQFARTQIGRTCSKNPKLSVIILNWNKSIMTLQCVYTLFKNTYHEDIEVVVVDNGSRDDEFRKLLALNAYPCVKVIRNKSNRFYGEANNLGVENSLSKNICLLNNDAFVGVNWDKYLLDELHSRSDVGGVGPKFLFPNGVLQEAGGELNPCGQNVQIGKGLNPELSFFNRKANVSHISAACFILERSVFDRINGFDYRYEPAYFEDADLTAKISALGLNITYVPNAEVIHVENATSKEPDIGFDFGSLIGTNRIKFVEKWGDYLRGGETPVIPDFSESYAQVNVQSNKKIAVVYSPYSLTPGGGERYVLSLAISARDSGYATYFCSPEKYSKYRFHTVAGELGLDVSKISLMSEDELINRNDVSIFIAMGNELSPSIKAQGADRNIFHCQFPFPMSDWHVTNCLSYIKDYDVVIVNSGFTKKAYKNEAGNYDLKIPVVKVISPPVDAIEPKAKNYDGVLKILNVGRFIAGGHCKKQIELVQQFHKLENVLSDRGIECKLTLVGSLGPNGEDRDYLQKLKGLSGNNVEIIVNASRETVIKNYQESNFYWHGTGINENIHKSPEIFEHFGITPVEAISAGCIPIVWYEGGPKEVLMDLGFNEMHFAKTVNDYCDKTISLLNNLSSHTVDTSQFSIQTFNKKIQEVINK